ncbi:hypothetical protein QUB37_05930 [Microcoleus sp. AT3-A2]|uniref:hypothetical protein n=1 Tax=Microcoleus sp. AT3-A2 TaxID=2818610 RepID=UPI002FD3D582
MIADTHKEIRKVITVYVSKNESNAKQLETELTEANFDSRAQSSLVVGYIEPGGTFQSL